MTDPVYTEAQWSNVRAVLALAGARLSGDEENECRMVLEFAAHTFSRERPGMEKKEADRIRARIQSLRSTSQELRRTPLGSRPAIVLASKLEQGLRWLGDVAPSFEPRLRARNIQGWLFVLERNLDDFEFDLEIEARHRTENPLETRFHLWLATLADIWERSGLEVRSTGQFPAFVHAAQISGIRGGAITDTSVRDFVLKIWRCRT